MIKLTPKTIVLILYHIFVGTIIAANFSIDQSLMGWDGLYPELNIPLNLLRGLTAGWQEYYGAGLVGGHGFAATLPHTLIIGLLSIAIPQHLVRSVFIFLCYYLGGLGMLLVSQKLLHHIFERHKNVRGSHEIFEDRFPSSEVDQRMQTDYRHVPSASNKLASSGSRKFHANLGTYIGLVTSIYYLTNLGTIQMFYLPLEAFTVHFAALPWLTYGLLSLLERVTPKRIAFFCMALGISSIQGFIPAVFASYGVSLLIITGVYLLLHRFEKKILRTFLIIWACVICVNAYWLGPVAYFTLTQSKDYINAYNNITTTPQFVAKSIQYGTLADTALLKSFLWESNELGGAILAPWKEHHANPGIVAIGYTFFGLAVLGLFLGLGRRRTPLTWGFALSSLYFFGNIAIATPPFSTGLQLIQSYSPELTQAFRTTFTKFGIGLAFHYSLLIGVGLYVLINLLTRITRDTISRIVVPACVASLIFFALPLWQGKLVYQKLFVTMPRQYQLLTRYLNTLPFGRIADFPQDCAEGWYNQLWGYFGSGFLWYGVNHPFMARAFDVWSHNNENYFWELSSALRQQDYERVERVFDKYGVRYVLYDQNITHCRSQKGFLSSLDFGSYLETASDYTKLTTFSAEKLLPITVFERNSFDTPDVSIIENPPNIPKRQPYNDLDQLFASTSAYVSDPQAPADLTDPDATEFSKRGTPLSGETLENLSFLRVATVAATISEAVPCQNTPGDTYSYSSRSASENLLRLTATNTKLCQSFILDNVNTTNPFVIGVGSRHIAGEPLMLSVINKGRPAGLDITVPKHLGVAYDYFYLPPTFPSEVELTIMLSNVSYNQYTSINDLLSVQLQTMDAAPLTDLSGLHKPTMTLPDRVSHPISSLYFVDLTPKNKESLLTLSQSFDPGWRAFTTDLVPLQNHMLVNNWANGWRINQTDKKIIIVFIPQALEYLGFLALIIPGIIVWRAKK